jgi:catechol 2,3-dioxygenase-like lactoylglutathione lyase family enzyme
MGLHRLNYIVREVPRLAEACAFYREFGLAEQSDGVFRSVVGGDQLLLRPGPMSRVVSVGVGADARSDVDDIAARLTDEGFVFDRTGATTLSVPEPATDVLIEVSVSPRLPKQTPAPTGARPRRDELVPRTGVRPMRLGHVVLGCPEVKEAERFFIKGLGMRLSDYVHRNPFMRFETDHHNIAVVTAPQRLLHHTAWQVRSVDEVGFGGSEMVRRDPERYGWGLGRHAASANYFWYLKDPAGAYAEYYHSEMDELADTPSYWDPVEDGPDLPSAVWVSPPYQSPLRPEVEFAAVG